MKKSTRIRFISAAALYVVLGLSGCAVKPKTIDLKQNSDVSAQLIEESSIAKKIYAPGEHTYCEPIQTTDYSEYRQPIELDHPKGYEIVSVSYDYVGGYYYRFITYRNIVTVEVVPTQFVEGEGFKYTGPGTPVDEKDLTKK